MCGRFTLTDRTADWAVSLGISAEQLPTDSYRPRWNIAPTDPHWIVRMKREDRELLPAKWGLVQFASKDAKRAGAQINARAETVATRPAYRNAWRQSRRCVVPADGFYEWTGPKEARKPLWFRRPDGGLLLFAGLYESWQPSPGAWQRTFTIITTTANELMAPVHDRMPVILTEEAAEEWLFQGNEGRVVEHMLTPSPEKFLVASPASTRANSVKNDDPACLEPDWV